MLSSGICVKNRRASLRQLLLNASLGQCWSVQELAQAFNHARGGNRRECVESLYQATQPAFHISDIVYTYAEGLFAYAATEYSYPRHIFAPFFGHAGRGPFEHADPAAELTLGCRWIIGMTYEKKMNFTRT